MKSEDKKLNKVMEITEEVETMGFSSRELMEYLIAQYPKLIKELEQLKEELANTLDDEDNE
jgi:2C-methyl-D-erythritol 2,4-cyclodiphosphate synthase